MEKSNESSGMQMTKMDDITIALIIPIYNVEPYMEQCLDSVVKQSRAFHEVILINDGSTDGSLSVCEKYLSKYEYFRLINQENMGLSAARNRGIECAGSEYIMFLDSDDYLSTDTVKRLEEQIEKLQYDAVFFDAETFYENIDGQDGRNIYDRSNSGLDKAQRSGWEYFAKCYPRDYVVSACMAIYRKKVIDDARIKFPEGIYYEDNYFSFQFLRYAGVVVHNSDKLYQRRYRKNSITRSRYSEKKFVDYIKVSLLIWKDIFEMDDGSYPVPKDLLLAFIGDHCIQSLKNYQVCLEQKISLRMESIALLKRMVKSYFGLLEKFRVNISNLDLPVLARMFEIFHNADCWSLLSGENKRIRIQEIVDIQKTLYMNRLKELPFHREGYTIGIYGTGMHTEGLLLLYEKLIGKIKCDLIFIDSRKDNGTYKNKMLIHYRKIPKYKLNGVIISSFIYEREMVRNVMSLHLKIPVYTFYQEWNGDVLSNYKIFLEHCDTEKGNKNRNDGKKAY